MSHLPDQDARRQAWQCFDKSISVTAGAGSGKTRVLVDRYLAWTLAEGWTRTKAPRITDVLSSILAITFTDKASGEMEERIIRSLQRIVGDDVPDLNPVEQGHVDSLARGIAEQWNLALETVIERASQVLQHTHRLEVSTIHAFASGVLRTWPIEAGIHPDFGIDADGQQSRQQVHRLFVETTRAGLSGSQAALFADLLARFGQGPLENLVAALVDSEFDGQLAPVPDTRPLPSLCRSLVASLTAIQDDVRANSRGKFDRIVANLESVAGIIERHGSKIATHTRETLSLEGAKEFAALKSDLGGYPPATIAKQLPDADAFRRDADKLHAFVSEAVGVDPHGLTTFVALYMPVVEKLRVQLKKVGWLSYDDLLRLTEQLLTHNPMVARSVANRYGQILVDEFQDTNSAQCRLLDCIANADPGAARLFVVGDPKQSIYSFRNADLKAYQQFTEKLQLSLVLTASFRSQTHLLAGLNRGFEHLFQFEDGLQPGPQALAPTRDALGDFPALRVWRSEATTGPRRTAAAARDMEAAATVQAIVRLDAQLPSQDKRWSRYAILSRVQTQAAIYADALADAGIPFVISGDKEFYRRQEVLDAVNLLRIMLDPSDGVAWIGVLRSPIGAVPDEVLCDLSAAGFFEPGGATSSHALAAVPSQPAFKAHLNRVSRLVTTLQALREQLLEGAIDDWLTQLLAQLPLPDVYASQYRGERKAGNFTRVLRDFCEAAVSETVPLSQWLDDVSIEMEQEVEESESALADDTTDAVRIMSIHASKGLQFDHVFLPYLDWRRGGGSDDRAEVKCSRRGWVLRMGNVAGWGIADLKKDAKVTAEAEAIRLLYVACTRARDSLTLMGLGGRGLSPGARAAFGEIEGPAIDQDYVENQLPDMPLTVHSEQEIGVEPLVAGASAYWKKRRELLAQTPIAIGTASSTMSYVPTHSVAASDEDALALGTEVHSILESFDGTTADLSGASPAAADIVNHFLTSPLAERLRGAKGLYKEVPFVASKANGGATVGSIDLLLETDDGWIVVDYKTNRVASQADAESAAEKYREQGAIYMDAVHRALGVAPQAFELWFLRGPWVVKHGYELKK